MEEEEEEEEGEEEEGSGSLGPRQAPGVQTYMKAKLPYT